jgi:hypothetical protein
MPIRQYIQMGCAISTKAMCKNCGPTCLRGEQSANSNREIGPKGTSEMGKASGEGIQISW